MFIYLQNDYLTLSVSSLEEKELKAIEWNAVCCRKISSTSKIF